MTGKKVDVLNLKKEMLSRRCSAYILSKEDQDGDFFVDDFCLSFNTICVCPLANMISFKNDSSYITIGNIKDIEIVDYPYAYMSVITIISVNPCNKTKNKYKILAKLTTKLY